jgi:archaellum component FlaC
MLSKEYKLVAEAINACKDVNPQIIHGQVVIEVLTEVLQSLLLHVE